MWKTLSTFTRLPHLRHFVNSAPSCAFKKNSSFGDSDYVSKKRWNDDDESDLFQPNHRNRDGGYKPNTWNRGKKYDMAESESRHYSFDADDGDNFRQERRVNKFKSDHRGFAGDTPMEKDNANLFPIGVPGKWKVGAGFVQEADRLRHKAKRNSDFRKIDKPRQDDPGIRRQFRATKTSDDLPRTLTEEELDEEVDVNQLDKVYGDSQDRKAALKELVKLKMVKQKYFKEPKENALSWSDKEHIRFLHNSDPQHWTFEMIADHFKIDFEVAKAVAKANWIPKKSKASSEFPSIPLETQSLVSATEEHRTEEPSTPSSHREPTMSWQELRESMGAKEDKISSVPQSKIDHTNLVTEDKVTDKDKDLVLQYLAGEFPSKWANSNRSEKITNRNENDTTNYSTEVKNKYLVI